MSPILPTSSRAGGFRAPGRRAALLLSLALAAGGTPAALAAPDLTPQVSNVSVVVQDVPLGDVLEGCAGGTTNRRLVRFDVVSRNLGPDDLVVGAPDCPNCHDNPGAPCGNPNYACSTAHGHAHFQSFVRPELLDASGAVVAEGYKYGFCLLDTVCPTPGDRQFLSCAYQGISAGCGDLYPAGLPCQYVDITDVSLAPGTYRLRVTIDPLDAIAEADETNNATETPLLIEPTACAQYDATDVPRAVPDAGGTASVVTVPAGAAVSDVNVVGLALTHPAVGDLEIHLISPSGTDVTVVDRVCGTADDLLLGLDDVAASGIPCPPTDGVRHRPSNPLVAFAGEDAAGPWTLGVFDRAAGAAGTLEGWSLQVCSCGDGTLDPGEACDDGNAAPGDGCGAGCRVEPCASCGGEPSTCTVDRHCVRCQRTVAGEAARFAQARAKVLAACELARVRGRYDGPCPDPAGDPRGVGRHAAEKIARALSRFQTVVGRRCGGGDETCGGGDPEDTAPAAIGFPGICPHIEGGEACSAPVDDCAAVVDCLSCLAGAGVDAVLARAMGDLLPSGSVADRARYRCQRAIGQAAQQLLTAQSRERQRCWDARLLGKHADPCPDETADAGSPARRAADRIARVDAKQHANLCRACGGQDGRCGGGDDLDPQGEIGFTAACDDVTVPDGAACEADVDSVEALAECVACVSAQRAACVGAAAVPGVVPLPHECDE